MYNVINIIQLAGVVVGFLAVVVVARQKASENQKVLLLACCCAFLSIFSYTLEINSTSFAAMLTALKFGYLGKCYVLLFFFMFMAAYCRVSFPKCIFRFFLILNTVMFIAIATCERHGLYYRNLHVETDGLFPHLAFERGVFYWVFMAVMLLMMGWYFVISVIELRKRTGRERKRLFLLSMTGIVPSFMLVVYLTGILDVFDPVPIGIVVACSLLTVNVVKYGLFDTLQLAKEKVVESTKEGLIIVDPDYRLLYANRVARDLFPDIEDKKKQEERLLEIFRKEQRESIVVLDGRNYEIRVSIIAEDSCQEAVKGYLAWIFDMTFISRYTEEMIYLRQEAENANMAKSSFLAHISHEIRTPMNAIIGYSDLCSQSDSYSEIKNYVGHIRTSAETLLNLINDVLDISKIECGKMELVEMEYSTKALISETVSVIGQQAQGKGLMLRYMLEERLPSVLYGDKTRVREIASNLLSNAVKYTDEGTILFKIKEIRRLGDKILIEIIVKDSGIGIRDEDKGKLFQKFERFDSVKNYAKEGTGLGLPIVKSLAELMEGSVEVESAYGKGSTFRVRIWQKIADETPIGEFRGTNQDKVILEGETYGNRQRIQFPKASVMVVDDNEVNQRVAYSLLKLYGIEADLFSSGKVCLEAAANKTYDLVFMDLMMPEMDGVEAMHRLREGCDGLPIVALTANTLVGVREEMLSEGFDDFLGKPIELTELQNMLEQFLKDQCQWLPEGDSKRVAPEEESGYEILMQGGIQAEVGETFCGDAAGYREILQTFADHGPKQQQFLREALQQRKPEQYEIQVHALKSSAAVIGAKQLSRLAKEHEKAIKEGNFEFVREHFITLQNAYEEVVSTIRRYLETL